MRPQRPYRHPAHQEHITRAPLGARVADRAASGIGSWRFLIVQTVAVTCWIIFNLWAIFGLHWDPAPFVLLNLLFSVQAAYTGPILLLAGNRQSQIDRAKAEADYETNQEGLAILRRLEEQILARVEK